MRSIRIDRRAYIHREGLKQYTARIWSERQMNPDLPISARVERVQEAFVSGVTRSATWRKSQLRALDRLLLDNESAFADALAADLDKPRAEAWLTEHSFVRNLIAHAEQNFERWMRPRRVDTPADLWPGRSCVRPEPLGTVLIIAPWNYPLQLCLSPLVTALAAGNCAVIKPSELAPHTSRLLAELLPRYLDNDCTAVVEGGVDASTALLDRPWGHIVFTGGARVARIVMGAAAQTLTPVTLELGGQSPCVVLPDADLDVAARRIAFGRFLNAGQSCIAPNHVLCDDQTRAALVPRLIEVISEMYGKDVSTSADYGRIVNDDHFQRLSALIEASPVVHGGRRDASSRYIEPTLIDVVGTEHPVLQEEIFGPLLPFVDAPDLDSAIDTISVGARPLAAYLFTRSKASMRRFERSVSAGSICINDTMVFMAIKGLPFGGVGNSGMGNYKGEAGFHRLSHDKAVLTRWNRPDFRLRYAPYTRNKLKWLRRVR